MLPPYNNATLMQRPLLKYTRPVCRGSVEFGTACGVCERCIEIAKLKNPKPATS